LGFTRAARAGENVSAAPAATLILTRREVADLMDTAAWLEAVEAGFRAAAQGKATAPPPMAIEGVGGTFHAKGASLALDRHYVALKLNGNFPGNPARRLPTIQGALMLCDGETGALLAIMDSIEVTLRRTAAATALAARYLARLDAASVLICGCGAQGAAQLAALREVRPIARCFAWDCNLERANALAATASGEGLHAEVPSDLATAALASDIIVTCTTSSQAFLDLHMVRAGTFVAAVGADSPEKSEIAPSLMANAMVVADVLDQCVVMGDLHHAIAAGAMTREAVHGELAEVVSRVKPGRTSADEITIFDSTGTGLQDVAVAVLILERAIDGHGRSVTLAA
jgi:alanine dehydrogenase